MDNKAYALMAILLASVASVALMGAAYAQTTSLTVSTDKPSYKTGDAITVTGKLTGTTGVQSLLIFVKTPQGSVARSDPFDTAADGSYSYEFQAGGTMNVDGTYIIEVSYKGTTKQTATFEFDAAGVTLGWKPFNIKVGSKTYIVEYQITGGSVTGMVPSTATSDLTISISSTTNGNLKLRLPREVIDSRAGSDGRSGDDKDFETFIDEASGDVVEDTTAKTDTVRQVSIDFDQGTSEIVLIGTWAIPEFGAMAAIILAVAIVGIIVTTARYGKLNFAPRL
jgi:predicted secreted protein with PEFG-CTERM motif